MTIAHSPYQTTSYRGFSTQAIKNAIELALVSQDLHVAANGLVIIDHDLGAAKDIKAFNHPLLVNYGSEDRVAVDVRYFVRKASAQDRATGSIVKAHNEYDLAIFEGLFTQRWIEGDERRLLSIHSVPMTAYSNWLADTITRRLLLDVREQTILRVIAAYFYASQFFDKAELNERDFQAITGMIARNLRIPAKVVIEVLEPIPVIKDINDFVAQVIAHSHSVRLTKLTAGAVVTLLSSSWFGINAARTCAVAIEHPPTWLALVLTSCTHRVYRNTGIARAIDKALGRNKPDQLLQALKASVDYEA